MRKERISPASSRFTGFQGWSRLPSLTFSSACRSCSAAVKSNSPASQVFSQERNLFVFILHLLPNGANLFQGQKQQYAGNAGTYGSLGDGQVRGFQQRPDDGHDNAVGHVDDQGDQQILAQAGGNAAHQQQSQKHQLNDVHGYRPPFSNGNRRCRRWKAPSDPPDGRQWGCLPTIG